MASRRATDDEIEQWQTHGWVLLHGIVGTEEIDRAADDLHLLFPTGEAYHADPDGETRRWLGSRADPDEEWAWPDGRARVPGGAAPLEGGVPVPRLGCAQPAVRASVAGRLRRAGPRVRGHPALPVACRCQVLGDHQLRAAPAHRPQPLVAPGRREGAVVEPAGLLVPVGRDGGGQPHPGGPDRRFEESAGDHPGGDARRRPRSLCGRAPGRRGPGLAAGLPVRRVPPRRALRRRRARPASSWPSDSNGQVRTGSPTTSRSRARQVRTGLGSSSARRPASSSCSDSRRPVTPSGTTPCWRRPRRAYPRLDLGPWRGAVDAGRREAVPSRGSGPR